MHFIFNFLFLLAALKWGDWRNWKLYYPTYLFFIGGDLFKNALLDDYRLWSYQETIFATNILFGHYVINFLIMLVAYSSTILIYLGNFPKQRYKQILWLLFWVALYSLIEFINLKYLHLFEHHYGWSMHWSILFNLVMFTVLKIHVKKPLLAWGISIVFFIIIFQAFHIPKEVFL